MTDLSVYEAAQVRTGSTRLAAARAGGNEAAIALPTDLEVVEITPDLAARWLLSNTHNRTMKVKAIARYAADIRSGAWYVNGETIKFAADGTLLDGQNRLRACIEAGRAFTSVVVRGLPH